MSKIKECYEDGFAEVNGRKYHFCEVTHKDRLKIFGYVQSIQKDLISGVMSFVGDSEYSAIEDLMFSKMTYKDEQLSRVVERGHFTEFGEDYIILATTAMQVFCYPFTKGTS